MNVSDYFLSKNQVHGRVEEWKDQVKEGHFYRFSEVLYENGPYILLHTFKILKETKCGHWVSIFPDEKKFILKSSRKRYALPTIQEAATSFIARKSRQHSIYAHRADVAKKALEIMQSLIEEF